MANPVVSERLRGPTHGTEAPAPPGICPRCHSNGDTVLFEGHDYLTGETYPTLRCDRCSMARTGLADGTDDPSRYYPPAYYGTDGQRFRWRLEKLIRVFRQSRVREVLRHIPGPGRILDVGCGRGWMLSRFHRRGWHAIGVEKSLEAVVAASQPGLEFLAQPTLSDCGLEPESFDVITLWHSLEHLEDPWETLDEIARLLAPGGIVVVEVPNLGSLQARLSRGGWFHLDPPRHRVHFTLDQLIEDLETRGLSILDRQTFSLEYGPYGMWQSLLNLATRQPNILYQLLRRQRQQGPATSAELLATILLLPIAVLLGTPLELAASLFHRGGIAHVVARKLP
ncbi:MAG: class I SAM-dependent methyltransferase [Acidobacteriota bacterium]